MITSLAIIRSDQSEPSATAIAAPYTAFAVLWAQQVVNFNIPGDTPIKLPLPSAYSRYRIQNVILSGADSDLSFATIGLFTDSGGAGTQIVTGGTNVTVTENDEDVQNNMQVFVVNDSNTKSHNQSPLYIRVITPTDGVGTFTIFYQPLS